MKKDQKTEVIQIRCTKKEKNRLKGLAMIYAGGNLSLLIIEWTINAEIARRIRTDKTLN